MPEVVRERRRLNDIGVEPAGRGDVVRVLLSQQLLGQAAPDLRHLQGVREPIVEDMALGRRTTCVIPSSRRKAEVYWMRSRSRCPGVR